MKENIMKTTLLFAALTLATPSFATEKHVEVKTEQPAENVDANEAPAVSEKSFAQRSKIAAIRFGKAAAVIATAAAVFGFVNPDNDSRISTAIAYSFLSAMLLGGIRGGSEVARGGVSAVLWVADLPERFGAYAYDKIAAATATETKEETAESRREEVRKSVQDPAA